MKQLRIFTCIIFGVVLLGGLTAGQGRNIQRTRPERPAVSSSAPKHSVIVKTKKGALIGGLFVRADAETVYLDLKGESRAIRLNDIESLSFITEEPQPAKPASTAPTALQPAPTPDAAIAQGRKAYMALRKLSAGAQARSASTQYAALLAEARAVVDEAFATMPDGEIKTSLAKAIEAFTDAGQAWGAAMNIGVIPLAAEPGATLMKKYSIKPAVNALGQEDRLLLDAALTAIWAVGSKELDSVAPLLKLNP